MEWSLLFGYGAYPANNIADNLALVDNGAACECHSTAKWLNVGDNIAVLILLHFV